MNLSNHSINTYIILCREVWKSFKAVPSDLEFVILDTITPIGGVFRYLLRDIINVI
jgi:hypothetical protein